MNTDNFLAAMSQDLTIKQLEDCGVIEFIKTGVYCQIDRPLEDSLSTIISNIQKIIDSNGSLITDTSFGICFNYSKIFVKTDVKNFDFYSLNYYFCTAIEHHYTGYPIPSNGNYWEDESLEYRIMYMQWIVRQLIILKKEFRFE